MSIDVSMLAEVGYAAYGDSVEWKNFQDAPMPTWEKLSDQQQGAWAAAAAKIVSVDRSGRPPSHEIGLLLGWRLVRDDRSV